MPRFRTESVSSYNIINRRESESTSPPLTFVILSVIQFMMFLIHYYNYESKDKPIEFLKGPVPTDSKLIFDPTNTHQLWRYFTCAFVHLSVMQLLACIGWQVVFGTFLEINYGWWKPLVIYISGVIATSLYVSLAEPKVYISGGAGGVFALIFADMTSLVVNYDDFRSTRRRENDHEGVLFVSICFILDIFFFLAFSKENTYDDQKTLVSSGWGPLLAGGLVGSLLALSLLRDQKVKHWGKVLWAIDAAPVYLGLILFLFCIVVISAMVDMDRNHVHYDTNYYYYRPYPYYYRSYSYYSPSWYYRPYYWYYPSRYSRSQYNSYNTYNSYRTTYSRPARSPADPYGYKRSNNPYGFNRNSNPYGYKKKKRVTYSKKTHRVTNIKNTRRLYF